MWFTEAELKSSRIYLIVPLAVVVLAGMYVTTIGASFLGSSAKSTVVPPASYVGTGGADRLTGTSANDVLRGRAGDDILYGRSGNDVLQGGIGNDRLYGGLGRDSLDGGRGNDRLYARDNRQDTVNGGPGFDEAWVDRLDLVRNVERVHRV
jgi:Ca2+-binding RTX toxin-like protein